MLQIKRPTSTKELEDVVQDLENVIISEQVTLIIIDSIAALVKKDSLDEKERESFLLKTSTQLKNLAEKCNCAVLATNQVVPWHPGMGEDLLGEMIQDSGMEYIPSLGATWHHCVSTRLFVNRDRQSAMVQTGGMRVTGTTLSTVYADRRFINIRKSPIAAPCSIPYTISKKGLELRSENDEGQVLHD